MLTPVLEELAAEAAGAWELAKVNSDEAPELSARYGVRGIPNVKLFVDGVPVAEFVGAQPATAVRKFLRDNIPSAADGAVREAAALLEAGEVDAAKAALEGALAAEPGHAAAHLALARIALAAGDVEAVESHAAAIPITAPEADVAGYVRDAVGFARECAAAGGEDAVRARAEAAPDDAEAQYLLGCCHAAAGRFQPALDAFLAVVAADRKLRDDGGRKAMLTVFGLVGIRSELSDAYRRKLSIYV